MPQRFVNARLCLAANDHARRPGNAPADAPRNRPAEARTPVGQRGAPARPHKPLLLVLLLIYSLSKSKNKYRTQPYEYCTHRVFVAGGRRTLTYS